MVILDGVKVGVRVNPADHGFTSSWGFTPGCYRTGSQPWGHRHPAFSGPKARDMTAWAGASRTRGGQGNPIRKTPQGLKGRTTTALPMAAPSGRRIHFTSVEETRCHGSPDDLPITGGPIGPAGPIIVAHAGRCWPRLTQATLGNSTTTWISRLGAHGNGPEDH